MTDIKVKDKDESEVRNGQEKSQEALEPSTGVQAPSSEVKDTTPAEAGVAPLLPVDEPVIEAVELTELQPIPLDINNPSHGNLTDAERNKLV